MFSISSLTLAPMQSARGVVRLPGSKSISNRVLLLAALCGGRTCIHDVLDSDDTRVMLDALQALGCVVVQNGTRCDVDSTAWRLAKTAAASPSLHLFLGNAGTAMRPLTAALALLGGDFELSGIARMHERPIGDLVDALRSMGCRIDCTESEGYPPLRIGRPSLRLDVPIQVRGDVSSQFLTALLLALPLVATQDIVVEVQGELISKPYVEITLNLLARFGVQVQRQGWQRFVIPAGSRYQSPGNIHIEADASSASYFVALGALAASADAPIRIEGVGANSIQGDIRFIDAAQSMGAVVQSGANHLEIARGVWPLKAIDLDCNHMPDAAMTLAVMALYAQGTTTLRNIASWRVKETDRIAAMATELRKLGATVVEGVDFIAISPPAQRSDWAEASIHTYDDHRMAMCFSLAAFNPAELRVTIEDPRCVGKTYPDYFEDFFRLAQTSQAHIPVICIDGPTASGKGSLASRLAAQLGHHYLDSGALYRSTAWSALQTGVALDDEAGLAKIARAMRLRFVGEAIYLRLPTHAGFESERDVGYLIRQEAIGMAASHISGFASVREALLAVQLDFRQLPGLVADGRDMGTVIFPDAVLKVFLTATAAARAERRHKQLLAKGASATLEGLHADLVARDERDANRAVAPLKAAAEAKHLDNSALGIEESVQRVMSWWQAASSAIASPHFPDLSVSEA
jgi:3-phosphoshikimate 1-carboxyvinyltransferase